MNVGARLGAACRRHSDLLWHAASYGFNRGFPFIAAFAAARILDIVAFGEFVAAVTFFATVLMVVDLGLSLSVTSRVARNVGAAPHLVPLTVFMGVALCLLLGVLAAVAVTVDADGVAGLFFGGTEMAGFVHAAAIYVPMAAIAAVLGGGFTGLQRYRTQAILGLIGGVAYFLAVIGGAWRGGALLAVWGAAFGMMFRALVSVAAAARSPLAGGWRASRAELTKEGRALAAIALPASIAAFAWMPTNSIILALILSEAGGKIEAGGLGAVMQVYAVVLVAPSLLTLFTLSRLSLITGPGAAARQGAFVFRWGAAMTALTLMFAGAVALFAPFIMGLFGPEFVPYSDVLVVMMACAALQAPQGIFSNYLVAAGRHWSRVSHWYIWAGLVLTTQLLTPEMTAMSSARAYLVGWIALLAIQGGAAVLDIRRRVALEAGAAA